MLLKGKTAIITGGSKGIGKAIAQRFMKEGAKVIVFDIVKPSYNVLFYKVDISDEVQIRKAMKEVKKADILVNNAGIYFQASIEQTSKEQLDRILDVNVKGTIFMCKHTLPLLKKSKGTIINISSALGVAPEPESPVYCATKSAIIMLTKCLAQEYASRQIRVNAILPGPIDTPLLRNAFTNPAALRAYAKKNPLRRVGTPMDVANVVAFLASAQASYVTGGLYAVDGGESTSSMYTK